ncbi:restriction endonuclease subunit S [Sporosarcina obsidiansis]|uniref:restriction endonuclease subunit S n=1 Tax=Sporosarcina obsidiansis TaxID=2660748 RepID=UPI00129B1E52|nr:restriction endonuclease subunit S [Sporosarcina obsidiansis]
MKEIYPRDWKEYKFGDVFDLGGSLSISRANLCDEGICYLHYGDIHKTQENFMSVNRDYDTLPKYNISLEEISSKYLLKDGDIVFADASEDYEGIGKAVAIINPENIPFISGLHTIVARDTNDTISYNYKRYFLSDWNIRKQLMILATGTSVYGLSKPNLQNLKIVLPDKKEQEKIGSILSVWDKTIELKKQLIRQKKEHKKGLMQNLLSGRVRFPGYITKWKKVYLGDICKISTGNKDTQNKVDDGIYPFFVRSQNVERINTFSYDGEAILTAGDGVGVGKVFHYINGKFDFHQRVYKLSDFKNVDGYFLYCYISQNFMKQIKKFNAKTSVDSVRREMLTKMLIDLPPMEEQEQIGRIIKNQETEILLLEKELSLLIDQKKSLMQQLLTGKIRVKV